MTFDTTDKELMAYMIRQVIFETNTLEVAKLFELDKENIQTQQEASRIVAQRLASRHLHWNGTKLNAETLANFQSHVQKMVEFSLCLNESSLGAMLEGFTHEIENPKGVVDNERNIYLKQKPDGTYAMSTYYVEMLRNSMYVVFDYSLLSDSEKETRKNVIDNFLSHYDAALDTSIHPELPLKRLEVSKQAVKDLVPLILNKQPTDLLLDSAFLQDLYDRLDNTSDFKVVAKELNLQTKDVATQKQVSEIVAHYVALKLISYSHRLHFDLAIKQLSDFSSDLDSSCVSDLSMAFKNALESNFNMFVQDISTVSKRALSLSPEYSSRMTELMEENFKQQGLNPEDVVTRTNLVVSVLPKLDSASNTTTIKKPNVSEFRKLQLAKKTNSETPKLN